MQIGAAWAGLRLAERWLCSARRLRPRRGPPQPLAPVLWVTCAGLILIYLSVFWMAVLERVRRPNELLYGEAVVLGQVQRLQQGHALYPPVTELPLSVTAYTPLYYILVGWLQTQLGDIGYTVGR